MSYKLNEYILLSHNDMDGAGCYLALKSKIDFDIVYHVPYNDISEHLHFIDTDITIHTKVVFITDLSFSYDDLIHLVRLSLNHPHVKFVYIDHHEYNDERGPIFEKIKKVENIKVVHEIGTSASKLSLRVIGTKNDDLTKLIDYIDAFDIWKQDHEDFKKGWFLNTMFWEFKMSGFKFNIVNENYKIPKSFKDSYLKIVSEKNSYFKELEDKNLIMKDDDDFIFIGFSDSYKSWFQVDYPEYRVHILPYISKNNVSVRIDASVPENVAHEMKEKMLNFVSDLPQFISGGGHSHAFGITIEKTDSEDLKIIVVQGLAKIASVILKEHNLNSKVQKILKID